MANIGTATVTVSPSMTGIQGKIAAGFKGAAGPATAALADEVNSNGGKFQGAVGKLGDIAKVGGLARAGGIAAGVAGLGALTGKALMAGAELEQQLGGSEAVFGEYASKIQEAAKTAYKTAGLSQQEFLEGANKMGSLYQGAGLSVQQSMDLSMGSMQRASDIASIMGIDTTAALEAVTGAAKGNYTMMDNLGVAMNDTALSGAALEKAAGSTWATMSQGEKTLFAQQYFMEKTAKYAGNYAKENATLSGSLNTTKKAFDNMLTGNGDVNDFIDSLLQTISIAVPKIVEMLPKIVTAFTAIISALIPAISAALPQIIPALINAVVSLIGALVAAMPTIIQALLGAMPALIDGFIKLFLAIVQALPAIVTNIANALPTIITALVNGLTNPTALQAIIMGAVQLLLALVRAIPIIIPPLVAAIPTIIRNILATLTNGGFINQMQSAGIQLLQATISGIVRTGAAVGSAVWEIIKIIGNTLSPSNLSRIGSDVIRGLWQGIQSMGGWITSNVKSLVTKIIPEPIRKALGIHSPSRVAAKLGKEVPAGLAQGINKASGLVETAAHNMADMALAGIGSPVVNASTAFGSTAGNGALAGQGGNSTTQTVSIANVNLGDASAVKEFFNQLNQDTMRVGMGLTPRQGAY